MTFKVGTRKSKLSKIQTKEVVQKLKEKTSYEFEITDMKSLGDKNKWKSIKDIDATGVFTRELDKALVNGAIDLAVHSSKDVPTDLSDKISVSAVTERRDPSDVLVGGKLEELEKGSVIGTGSPRRKAQILRKRPDIEVKPIRGNVETRVSKVGSEVDAVVLAKIGLVRLGMEDRISEVLPLEEFLPAPGQACMTITTRKGDDETRNVVKEVDHEDSRLSITAERAVLEKFGDGCSVPIGAHAKVEGNKIVLKAEYLEKGRKVVLEGSKEEPQKLGFEAAKKLMEEDN